MNLLIEMSKRATSLVICFCFIVLMTAAHTDDMTSDDYGSGGFDEDKDTEKQTHQISDHRFFLKEIFTKYGHDGQMTFEGFEHLLESLGLGNIIIKDHDLMAHKVADAFRDTHPSHEHFKNHDDHTDNKKETKLTTFSDTSSSRRRTDLLATIKPLSHSHHADDFPNDDHHDTSDHGHHHGENHNHVHFESAHSSHRVDHHLPPLRPTEHIHKNDEIPELIVNITSLADEHQELADKSQKENVKLDCLSPMEILMTFDINPESSFNHISFLHMCPAIIYELDQRHCFEKKHDHHNDQNRKVSIQEWMYATISVIIISLCGLFSVAVIPIMQKWFYHTLLQFLVGLAIGSLSGDALLHLMPHAMLGGEAGHSHDDPLAVASKEEAAVWRGMTALGGIYFFFIAEKLLSAFTTYRKKKIAKAKMIRRPKSMIPVSNNVVVDPNVAVGEKLSQYRKNSYGVTLSPDGKEEVQMLQNSDQPPAYNETSPRKNSSRHSSTHEVVFHGRSSFSVDPEPGMVLFQPTQNHDDSRYEIGVSEHHGHGHGHSHEVPQSVSAVAWMVIMGDGLHNFCDGLAIGAAFASGIAGGISTTVAVFCHELPHELGDFAMLLKTGMKVKQALLYNGLSSVLCFIGMTIGVSLGSMSTATTWIFAGTAGMFIYIALVDMLPELSTFTSDSGSTATYTLAVQVLGISTGITVMLLIAIYEHDLKRIVS